MISAWAVLIVLLTASCSVFEAIPQPDLPDNIDAAEKLYLDLNLKGTEGVLQQILASPDEQPEVKAEALRKQARKSQKAVINRERTLEICTK